MADFHLISLATPDQLPLLVQLEQQTFTETFGGTYTPEDLAAFLQDKKSGPALLKEMTQPGSSYFIIYCNNIPAGFLKINLHRQPDSGGPLPGPVLELEKIYILQAFQGKKLGKLLIEKTMEIARNNQVKTVWLGVWEHNHKAFQFYLQQGFERFGEHVFRVGNQEDTDWLLKKHLL